MSFDLIDFYHNESRLLGVDSLKVSFEETGAMLRKLSAGMDGGIYPLPAKEERVEAFPLAEGPRVYRDLADGTVRGKAVLVP